MKQAIELSGHKAEIDHIFPQLADDIWRKEDAIVVWIELQEPIDSTVSFAVELPARHYSKEEFLRLVVVEGEKRLLQFRAQYAREKTQSAGKAARREKLQGIINEITGFLEV